MVKAKDIVYGISDELLIRIKTNQIEMMRKRGFEIPESDMVYLNDHKSALKNIRGAEESEIYSRLSGLYGNIAVIYIFVPNKLAEEAARTVIGKPKVLSILKSDIQYVQYLYQKFTKDYYKINRKKYDDSDMSKFRLDSPLKLIVIKNAPFSKQANNELEEFKFNGIDGPKLIQEFNIEFFYQDSSRHDIHIGKRDILSEEETAELLKKYGNNVQMSDIFSTDTMVQYYNLPAGTIIRYEDSNPNMIAGIIITYRRVKDISSQ